MTTTLRWRLWTWTRRQTSWRSAGWNHRVAQWWTTWTSIVTSRVWVTRRSPEPWASVVVCFKFLKGQRWKTKHVRELLVSILCPLLTDLPQRPDLHVHHDDFWIFEPVVSEQRSGLFTTNRAEGSERWEDTAATSHLWIYNINTVCMEYTTYNYMCCYILYTTLLV